MRTVNMLEAKSTLSQLVSAVENGSEAEIIIARNGMPAAKLVPMGQSSRPGKRLGALKGQFPKMSLEDFNALDDDVAALFGLKS